MALPDSVVSAIFFAMDQAAGPALAVLCPMFWRPIVARPTVRIVCIVVLALFDDLQKSHEETPSERNRHFAAAALEIRESGGSSTVHLADRLGKL